MNSVNNIINSPANGIKLIFFVHLTCTVWATQSGGLPLAYTLYNTFLLISLLWSLAHKDLEDPLLISGGINALSILFDAIIIGIYYQLIYSGWSMLMAVLQLILRPITTILLIRYYNERSDSQINIPGLTNSETQFGNGRQSYESIDRQNSAPNNTGGSSFA